MSWSAWVSTPEAHARASGRRGYNKRRQEAAETRREEVRQLPQRWGTTAQARVNIALVLGVSLRTITRDWHALQERPPVPLLYPLCGLPSRLDVDPTDLTDDPVELARLEVAMARLVGADQDEEAARHRRPSSCIPGPERRQRDDRLDPKARTLGPTTAPTWG